MRTTRVALPLLVFLTVAFTAACGGGDSETQESRRSKPGIRAHIEGRLVAAPDNAAPDRKVARVVGRVTGLRVLRADCFTTRLGRASEHPGTEVCFVVFESGRLQHWWIERQQGRITDLGSLGQPQGITNSWWLSPP